MFLLSPPLFLPTMAEQSISFDHSLTIKITHYEPNKGKMVYTVETDVYNGRLEIDDLSLIHI